MPRLSTPKAVVPLACMAFCFLHLFSGARDKLSEAIKSEAEAAGVKVITESYDLCNGHDLLDPALVQKITDKARRGEYHAAHAGFPCTTFTRLRWRAAVGQPGPVRSRSFICGLPTNSRAQQNEADTGDMVGNPVPQDPGPGGAHDAGPGPVTSRTPLRQTIRWRVRPTCCPR